MIPKGFRRLPRLNTVVTMIIRDKKGTKTMKVAERVRISRHLREHRFVTRILDLAPCGQNTSFILVLSSDDRKHSNASVTTNFLWDYTQAEIYHMGLTNYI